MLSALWNSHSVFSYDFEVGGIYYNLKTEDMTAEVTNGDNKYTGDVIIPSTVTYNTRTLHITSIGPNAFGSCYELSSVVIPNSIVTIKEGAFSGCSSLSSVTLGNSIETIQMYAFAGTKITSLEIPNSVTSIGVEAFRYSYITNLVIPDNISYIGNRAFSGCSKLESVNIGSGLTSLSEGLFNGCKSLTYIDIPNNIEKIGTRAFNDCSSLTNVKIGSGVTYIDTWAFLGCSIDSLTFVDGETSCSCPSYDGYASFKDVPINHLYLGRYVSRFHSWKSDSLKSLTIGKNIKYWEIGKSVFCGDNVTTVRSHIIDPTQLNPQFPTKVYSNATLYVPKGTKTLYEQATGWKNFFVIVEEEHSGEIETKKCSKPTISYSYGKLIFNCETDGAICQSTITNSDIATFCKNEVQLGVTYNISVFATKLGYENSEVTTATLCWIDVEPKTEGIENCVVNVKANAILIQSENGHLTVSGVDDGTRISVFGINGVQVGSATSHNGRADISTNLLSGSIAIIKVGDRRLKVTIK